MTEILVFCHSCPVLKRRNNQSTHFGGGGEPLKTQQVTRNLETRKERGQKGAISPTEHESILSAGFSK